MTREFVRPLQNDDKSFHFHFKLRPDPPVAAMSDNGAPGDTGSTRNEIRRSSVMEVAGERTGARPRLPRIVVARRRLFGASLMRHLSPRGDGRDDELLSRDEAPRSSGSNCLDGPISHGPRLG